MIRTALTTLAIVGILGLGTTLDDHSAEQAQADDLQQAQQQAAAEHTYRTAVQRLCGPNAAWMELQGGAIQCTTKHGKPTTRVTLVSKATP